VSNTQIAFLNRNNVPRREALQASIDKLGFNLKLDPEFTPFEDSGFSPCTLDGIPDVGFEVFYAPTLEVTEGDPDLATVAGDRDFSISMVWHSSMKDCACVMIVSCALAKDFDAVISYEGEEPEPFESLLASTKEIVADATKPTPSASARERPANAPMPRKPLWCFW